MHKALFTDFPLIGKKIEVFVFGNLKIHVGYINASQAFDSLV